MARLGQLIKKLEIGTDTAVDFLKSNGCEIKNDLNAKLDAHQEELLINKFASEEVKAEIAAKKQKKENRQTIFRCHSVRNRLRRIINPLRKKINCIKLMLSVKSTSINSINRQIKRVMQLPLLNQPSM